MKGLEVRQFRGWFRVRRPLMLGLVAALALIGAASARAGAAIAERGTATFTSEGNTSSITIAKPTGVISGDVLLAFIWRGGTTTAMATPSGWNLIGTNNDSSKNVVTAFWRRSDGTDGSSYTFTFPGNANP